VPAGQDGSRATLHYGTATNARPGVLRCDGEPASLRIIGGETR
jgi:hypothetical protein